MDQGQFVVIHGMAGAGKSVLAAESIRDIDLLVNTFENNVYWLTVGQTGTDTLLTKMQVYMCSNYVQYFLLFHLTYIHSCWEIFHVMNS